MRRLWAGIVWGLLDAIETEERLVSPQDRREAQAGYARWLHEPVVRKARALRRRLRDGRVPWQGKSRGHLFAGVQAPDPGPRAAGGARAKEITVTRKNILEGE